MSAANAASFATGHVTEHRRGVGAQRRPLPLTARSRPPAADYNVVLVDLAEGCRMMSRVEGIDPQAVKIGMAVRARIALSEDGPFIVFDPETAA